MTSERPRYLAFMLRLWRVEPNGRPTWVASLENPHTGEHRRFASAEALLDFLRTELSRTEPRVDETQALSLGKPGVGE